MITLQSAIQILGLEANRPSTPMEIFAGRFLAVCAHPVLGWRVLSRSGRLVVFGGYAVAAYVTVLTLLLLART